MFLICATTTVRKIFFGKSEITIYRLIKSVYSDIFVLLQRKKKVAELTDFSDI